MKKGAVFRWKVKPLLASKNVLCVLRVHASYLCVKKGDFSLEIELNQQNHKKTKKIFYDLLKF
ncbi:hypothetical protein C2S30_06860 [Helicobacter pylori]|nr:hypothetical protein C2S30_06860 [Helicobacter pylori]